MDLGMTPKTNTAFAMPNIPRGGMATGGGAPYLPPTVIPGQPSPVAGMPASPGYIQNYNPQTMSLLPGYQQTQAANDQGYDAYSQAALRKGPSPWATMASQQQNQMETQNRNKAATTSAGTTAGTEAALASTGGLSSGARERAQEGGARSTMGALQGASEQNTQNQTQIGMNDEQNRMQMLSQLPGMEQQRVSGWENVAGGDLNRQVAEDQAQNQYNMGIYGIQSTAAAANNTANAEQAAADAQAKKGLLGDNGGFLGTGLGSNGTFIPNMYSSLWGGKSPGGSINLGNSNLNNLISNGTFGLG